MSQVLDALDNRIEEQHATVAEMVEVLRSAHALRERLESDRVRARGRLAEGDASAGVDLDHLREALLAARHDVQDAEAAVATAQSALPELVAARAASADVEATRHLQPVLEVRLALADLLEAQLAELAETITAYEAAVAESSGLAGFVSFTLQPSREPAIVRRLLNELRQVLPKAGFVHQGPEAPLGDSDRAATERVRAHVAQATAAASSPTSAAR